MQTGQALFFDVPDTLSGLLRVAIDKVFDQQADVFLAIAQRRNLQRKNIDAIVQVGAERAGFNARGQVPVRGHNDSNIGANRLIAADTLKFPFL